MADAATATAAFCTNYVPCNDSPLSMSANIAGLITLTIATYAALKFYVFSYRNGINAMLQVSTPLITSFDELEDATSASEAYLDSASAEHENDPARERARAVQKAASEANNQIIDLCNLVARYVESLESTWSRRYSRVIFAARQSVLNRKVGEMDKAMDLLRVAVKRCAALLSSLLYPSMFATGDE